MVLEHDNISELMSFKLFKIFLQATIFTFCEDHEVDRFIGNNYKTIAKLIICVGL